jgi:hypothetical protein
MYVYQCTEIYVPMYVPRHMNFTHQPYPWTLKTPGDLHKTCKEAFDVCCD